MKTRERILKRVWNNQPRHIGQQHFENDATAPVKAPIAKMQEALEAIGASVFQTNNLEEISRHLQTQFPQTLAATTIASLATSAILVDADVPGLALSDVDVAILPGVLGIAENGAIWLNEAQMSVRALPFICQHLILVLDSDAIFSTMTDAYKIIADRDYAFGVFIAGPSKTADIEQSLVHGAHGPKTLTVFLLTQT